MASVADGGRSVVLGAGIAGLLAARALADHSDNVVVVEHDALQDAVADRRGVAQGRHLHALLARGQQVLEAMFPGITEDLASAGARTGDLLACSRLYLSGHRLRPAPSGLTAISASRALLELHIRRRVLGRANVEVIDGCDASGLLTDAKGSRVIGVRLARSADDDERVLPAGLVVDATGRNGHAASRLDASGVTPVVEESVVVDVAYATRRYRMEPDALAGDLAIIMAPTPAHARAGALGLIEGDTAVVTLAGMAGDRPPLDPAGFEQFAHSLAFPDIRNAIEAAEPLDDPVRHRFPASTWRRFDRLSHLPDGYAVVGDAVCSLNPIYGQGMTVAALEADALGRHLARRGRLEPSRYQREIARIVRPAWEMSAGADLQIPGTQGRRRRSYGLLGAYVSRLHRAAASDATLSNAFVRVSGLVEPPPRLFDPRVVVRVLASRNHSQNGSP
jgi:2-polyprenyl-6-methoxyphenol hydroxylase-like FAD-dependent oxidoreductase